MLRVAGPFDRYELTAEEMLHARILDANKQAMYQTMLSQFYEQKQAILFDPTKVLEFAQQEAEIRGQIMLLQALLADSEVAKAELLAGGADSSSFDTGTGA